MPRRLSITDAQVRDLGCRERPCPCCSRPRRLKDNNRTLTVRTAFGKLALPNPRYERCRCESAPGVAAPVVTALPERVTPDLLALEARWASLMAYGVTAALLALDPPARHAELQHRPLLRRGRGATIRRPGRDGACRGRPASVGPRQPEQGVDQAHAEE